MAIYSADVEKERRIGRGRLALAVLGTVMLLAAFEMPRDFNFDGIDIASLSLLAVGFPLVVLGGLGAISRYQDASHKESNT